jgi:hypothetical protein
MISSMLPTNVNYESASSAAPGPGDVFRNVEDKANLCRKAPANYRIIFIEELPRAFYGYVCAKLAV